MPRKTPHAVSWAEDCRDVVVQTVVVVVIRARLERLLQGRVRREEKVV